MAIQANIYMDRLDLGKGGHTRSILWALDDLNSLGVRSNLRMPTPINILKDIFNILIRIPDATIINALGVAYRIPMIFYMIISLLLRHEVFIYWHETEWVFKRLNKQKSRVSKIFLFLVRNYDLQHLVTSNRAKLFCTSLGIQSNNIHIIGECARPIQYEALKFAGHKRSNILTVMSVGSIQLRKGTDIFCEAAIQVCKKNQNIDFVWIGPNIEFNPGLYEDCLSRIKMNGLENRIRFYGFLEDPLSYLAEADIYLLCSRDDPMPLSNLEAMLLSKTVIMFDVGGGPEALDQTGHVLEKPDADILAIKILDLAKLPRETLIRKDAYQRALSEFTPGPFARRLKLALLIKQKST